MRYGVVIEKGEQNYSAYVPDLPGCVAVGDTLEEVKAEIRERLNFISGGCGRTGFLSRNRRVERSRWRLGSNPRKPAWGQLAEART